jgi:DNA-binding transcriptional MerR regulator
MNIDTKKLKQALIDAALNEKGDCYTTRAAFSMRFDEISALGEKGFSIQQITDFLWEGGLKLKKDVVRQYYYEHQIDKMEKIEQSVKVQIDEILKKLQEASNDDAEQGENKDNTNAQTAPAAEPLPHCLALQPHTPFERREDVPEEVYMEGQMEHPYIPGLILSKAERLYSGYLEIVYKKGVVHFETIKERTFRIKWMMPIHKNESSLH